MKNFLAMTLAVIGIAVVIALLAAVLAFPTMWVVNYLFASTFLTFVFGGALTFWKALALNFITGFLFSASSSSKAAE